MTPRIKYLRDYIRDGLHAEHRMFLPDDWSAEGLDCSLSERKAFALKHIIEIMPIYILDGELLVGSRTVYGRVENTKDDEKHRVGLYSMARYATLDEIDEYGGGDRMQKNHCMPSYRMPLGNGLDGMREAIAERMKAPDLTKAQNGFLLSELIALDCVTALANRYSDLAMELYRKSSNTELLQISNICKKVAHQSPDTMQEAMQLYLFVYYVLDIEQATGVGFGRVDQLFLPFVDKLDGEELDELIACFLLKLNDDADINLGDLNLNGQNSIVLCGVDEDGNDATNELSRRFIRIMRELHISSPMPCIRVASTTPDDIIERVCHLNLEGINSSALYNDDMFVKALASRNIDIRDARNWALDLCQDVLIGGMSDVFLGDQYNLLHPICKALAESDDGVSWQEFYGQIKKTIADDLNYHLTEMAQFEECARLWPEDHDSFKKALAEGRLHKPYVFTLGQITSMLSPYPALSAFVEGCTENARDITRGGAKYKHKGVFGLVPTNAINSLVAIEYCAFKTKQLTLSQIKMAIEANFSGYDDVRLKLLNAPKWGNDDDECDILAKDYIEYFLKEIEKYSLCDGTPLLCGIHQPHTQAAGKNYGATPDGRFAREPVPVTLSPTNGTDLNGPTAVMNSNAKLDPMLLQWNAALTMSFDGSGDEEKKNEKAHTLAMLIRGYFDKGGMEFQPNVLRTSELIDAQMHPEKHKDLIVRVWGVSMFFVELSKQWQDEIIARTTHLL